MFRLILKVLLVYWIAAGIVIFIVDFEPHRQIHHPELLDALNSSLAMNGRLIAEEVENGRCSQIQNVVKASAETLAIAARDGRILCGDTMPESTQKLVASAVKKKKRMTMNHAFFQLIATPVQSASGKDYVVLLKTNYASSAQIYGLLPGYTTIIISFVTTVVVAFLVALPIRRLRKAAQEIAAGKLDARVQWGNILERIFGGKNRDDIARLVRDFNHMAERLLALTESQRILLRDVSHELRSPLARIRIGIGLMQKDALDPSTKHHLDRIENDIKRLNDLIGQILSLSQLETIQELPELLDISLSDLVEDLLPGIQYEAGQHGCIVTAKIEPGCAVKGDEELLRSAVENILRNAIRYVPPMGKIHVEAVLTQESGTMQSVIRIVDNGPGIPEKELVSVLKPFYRGAQPKHWQKDGFGIGLAIAHRAVGVLGGSIFLENRPEGGLAVQMSFPQIK